MESITLPNGLEICVGDVLKFSETVRGYTTFLYWSEGGESKLYYLNIEMDWVYEYEYDMWELLSYHATSWVDEDFPVVVDNVLTGEHLNLLNRG